MMEQNSQKSWLTTGKYSSEQKQAILNHFNKFVLQNKWIQPLKPMPKQAEFLMCPEKEVLFGGAAGPGKLISLDTSIPTPNGWSTIGDLHIGDYVFGLDGKPYSIIWESEVQNVDGYRLIFDDGNSIIAHDEHLWITFDYDERAQLKRRTDSFRSKRREKRPSRIKGTKSQKFTDMMIKRNKENPPKTLESPKGTIRTTKEIIDTLKTRNKKSHINHAIQVANSLQLPEKDLPLNPYLLGCWLGDGTTLSGSITTTDPEIIEEFLKYFKAGNIQHKKNGKASTHLFYGLTTLLRKMGVLGHKHIPEEYLWASEQQRLSLLQGLMDTDGCCNDDGGAEYSSTKKELAEDVKQLIISLGYKVYLNEGIAKIYGRVIGEKYRVTFTPRPNVFRLKRKQYRTRKERRSTTIFRYIINAEKISNKDMKCFKVNSSDGLFLVSEGMIATHNSWALFMAALMYMDIPDYSALLIRKSYNDLSQAGCLIPISMNEFGLGVKGAKWRATKFMWDFPSGASLAFGYLQSVVDIYKYQGSRYQFIGWDELTQHEEKNYLYLYSRLRRSEDQDIPLRMWSTSNPGGGGHSWVKERFVDSNVSERVFIPARLDDNTKIDKSSYINSLMNLDPITRRQLMDGDWTARQEGGKFRREWFQIVGDYPHDGRFCRWWDLAATKPKKANADPDWTAGVLLGTKMGQYYVVNVRRIRDTPAEIEKLIKETTESDAELHEDYEVCMEKERGSAGINLVDHYARNILPGYNFHGILSTGDKEIRANPFSSACEAGNVKLVQGQWIPQFLEELEGFPEGRHDDVVDSVSGAYQRLSRAKGFLIY